MRYNNKSLADAFARGVTDGKANNLFIERGVLYSYGYHFPIAVTKNGKTYVNGDRYSPSTARHQSYLRTALNRNGVDWYETSLADVRAHIAGEY